jgi:adenylate cyclase
LQLRFRNVLRRDPDIASIYLLTPTQLPTRLRFVADVVRQGASARPGELYDASDVPLMLKGFSQPVVESVPTRDRFGLSLSGYAPVNTKQGVPVAVLGVDVSAGRLDQIRRDVLRNVAVSFGVTILMLGAVATLLGWRMREPLSRIMAATKAISEGELGTRVGLERQDELGLMSRHIDRMAGQLQEREFIHDVFGRFLSADVAAEVLRQGSGLTLGGEERVVSVLFMDLRGYSTISEQLSPQQVIAILNTYLGVMNEIIDQHNGTIIEFLGDAIFAVFGAPSYLADHAVAAVRCGMAMQQALDRLNHTWQQEGLARLWQRSGVMALSARVGIHCGPVVVGNLGSQRRMKYSVIGDTVNIAARLEALNKVLETDLLVSQDVFVQLPEAITANSKDQGPHRVKGRSEPIRIYSLSWHVEQAEVLSHLAKSPPLSTTPDREDPAAASG